MRQGNYEWIYLELNLYRCNVPLLTSFFCLNLACRVVVLFTFEYTNTVVIQEITLKLEMDNWTSNEVDGPSILFYCTWLDGFHTSGLMEEVVPGWLLSRCLPGVIHLLHKLNLDVSLPQRHRVLLALLLSFGQPRLLYSIQNHHRRYIHGF